VAMHAVEYGVYGQQWKK